MADRSNKRLNEAIENCISQWDGTIHGYQMKNAYENGTDYETMCEMCNLDYEDYKED